MTEAILSQRMDEVPQFFAWSDPDDSVRAFPALGDALQDAGTGCDLGGCVASGWPQGPVLFRDEDLGAELRRKHSRLLDEPIGSGGVPAASFRFVQDGKPLLGTDIPGSGEGLAPSVLNAYRQRRGTCVFVAVEQWHRGFAQASDGVAARLGARTGVSVFESAPGVRGFPAHYDTSHSVLFQVSGSKRWRLWPGPIDLPADEHPWPDVGHLYPDGALQPHGKELTADLRAGDCLWIPTGWVHEGLASEQGSVHVTLGIRPTRLFEILQHMTDSAGNVPVLRGQVPPGPAQERRDELDLAHEALHAFSKAVQEAPATVSGPALASYLLDATRRPLLE